MSTLVDTLQPPPDGSHHHPAAPVEGQPVQAVVVPVVPVEVFLPVRARARGKPKARCAAGRCLGPCGAQKPGTEPAGGNGRVRSLISTRRTPRRGPASKPRHRSLGTIPWQTSRAAAERLAAPGNVLPRVAHPRSREARCGGGQRRSGSFPPWAAHAWSGCIDLVQDQRIIDFKTSGTTPNADRAALVNATQATAYSHPLPGEHRQDGSGRRVASPGQAQAAQARGHLLVSGRRQRTRAAAAAIIDSLRGWPGAARLRALPGAAMRLRCEFFAECAAWH